MDPARGRRLRERTLTHAAGTVGTTFPDGFAAIEDTSLHKPLIGFGAAGAVARTPVIFIHGNNDTPFPTVTASGTVCNPYGRMQAFAQHFADNGYSTAELWGIGYEGDQCDLAADAPLEHRAHQRRQCAGPAALRRRGAQVHRR